MKKIIGKVTKAGYQNVAKPVLFKLHPDGVHKLLVRTSRIVQKTPLSHALKIWSYQHPALSQELMGLTFRNPVGLSAGFDKNVQLAPTMKAVGYGFMTGGSVTAKECDGNPHPWFYRLPKTKSLVVYAGLPNHGILKISHYIAKYPRNMFNNFPLVVSVAKTNNKENASDQEAIEDYCTSLRLLEDRNLCQMYEINISCPNTYGGEPFNDPERLDTLLTAVDNLALTRPVTIKMPIDLLWKDFSALLDVVIQHDVQAVTIGNLLKNRKNAGLKDDLPDDVKGGLSGVPTRDIATEHIRNTYRSYGHLLKIIGVGGIFSADDAYQKIRAGASLVDLITGMIFEGPQLIGQINRDLAVLLERDGYKNISEAVGVDVKISN